MNERVEEIRRHWEQQHAIREGMREQGVEPSSSWYDEEIPYLLAALARAERELSVHQQIAFGLARAEVERLKGELNEAKEEVRRQVEMRMLDQGRHHVDLQEASGQIAPESLCSCGETLRETRSLGREGLRSLLPVSKPPSPGPSGSGTRREPSATLERSDARWRGGMASPEFHAEMVRLTAENERLRAENDTFSQQNRAWIRENTRLEARIAALEADLAFLGATRTEDGLQIDMRKYHAAHGTDPARVAALEELLERWMVGNVEEGWDGDLRERTSAALARPTPTPEGEQG